MLLIAIPAFAYAGEQRVAGGEDANNQVEATQDLVDFVYVDSMELSVGETQYVAFSVKDDIAADKPVSLHYRNLIDGAEYVSTASNIVDGSALFELQFSTGTSGTYQLTDIFYSTKSGLDHHMDLLALSETSTFIVAEEHSSQVLSLDPRHRREVRAAREEHSSQVSSLDPSEEGSGIEVYGIDDDGDLVKSDGLFGTLPAKARASRANGRNLVVVIDPGHGGYDPGAVAGGLVESNLNLKIAQYCAQELRTYWGVEVYMTRESDVLVDLDERADFAKEKNADFFISIHINSGGGKGAEVWIPAINESWCPSYHEIGKEVANKILSSLKSLGLSNRGAKFDYYTINGGKFYPDGSRADSLAVIRCCREYGIPAILVEHGFIDNGTDASILASESKLKSMGVSEAKAVAEYLQLSKEKKPDPSVTWMRNNEIDLVWDAIPGATRYAIAMKTESGYKTFTYDCTSTSYTVSGLTDTKTYQFLVQAYVNGRWTTFTDRDLLTCTLIPMPEARVASTGDGTVTLEWD
ncbi:MAG: N-acetylmuramoyl-L-alanine amidase, partial [Atopobiaceae bacterium]|nr:N-acetylmuramoyl-L-alanine amidase [Atopobiaceae bacterium]